MVLIIILGQTQQLVFEQIDLSIFGQVAVVILLASKVNIFQMYIPSTVD